MSVTISGSGQIIKQVVQVVKTDVFTAALSSTWGDITGLSATITPTNASNKILVIVSLGQVYGSNDVASRLVRGATPIFVGDAAGTRTQVSTGNYNAVNAGAFPAHYTFMDSPATTTATTYKVQCWTLSGATFYLNETGVDSDIYYRFRSASSITLMEVAYA